MKKLLTSLGLVVLFGVTVGVLSHAGTPQDQGAALTGQFYHTTIYGSSTAIQSATITAAVVPPAAVNSGGLSIPYANCFTKFDFYLSSASVATIYDGVVVTSDVVKTIQGAALGANLMNAIVFPEDHLGPLCLTPGNTTNIVVSTQTIGTVSAVTGIGNTVNWEGYTSAGPGSNRN